MGLDALLKLAPLFSRQEPSKLKVEMLRTILDLAGLDVNDNALLQLHSLVVNQDTHKNVRDLLQDPEFLTKAGDVLKKKRPPMPAFFTVKCPLCSAVFETPTGVE